MSLSNPKQENPVTKWIEYSGETGKLYYYDKEKAEKVFINIPVTFIVLEEMNTITGFSKSWQSGIYSNEISDINKEKFHVKTFKGGFNAVGYYKDIKETIVSQGGHFTKSVYAAIIRNDGSLTETVNFKFKGAGLKGYFDKKVNIYKSALCLYDNIAEKTGKIEYTIPQFKAIQWTKEQFETALKQEAVLQEYLKQYKSNQIIETDTVTEAVLGTSNLVEHFENNILYEEIPEINIKQDTTKGDDLPF